MDELLKAWNLSTDAEIRPLTSGLINFSFKVTAREGQTYILQKINKSIFKKPDDLMDNYKVIYNHLNSRSFQHECPKWLTGKDNNQLQLHEHEYWRIGIFYDDTESIDVVSSPDVAFAVGSAFGQFDRCLLDLDTHRLKDTIPAFHDLKKYLMKLQQTKSIAPLNRLTQSQQLLDYVDDFYYLTKYSFPKHRVIHNDAKITNLLFQNQKVFAIIDWDTTMAGHISWEYADLFRSVGVTVPEDHPQIEDLQLDYDRIQGLSSGFKSELYDHLSDHERDSLYYGSLYLIFEQAVRFLEDYLAGDIYYNCEYETHNWIRARNQFRLLSLMVQDKSAIMKSLDQA